MSESLLSYIAIVSNLDSFAQKIESTYPQGRVKFFFRDSFLIDDAKSVVQEAHVAESTPKILALGAKDYNIYAQNALLKILEEPPRNIVFILASLSKTALLPTVRSRLKIKDFREVSTFEPYGLNFLELEDIYRFVKKHKFISRQELKIAIQTLSIEATHADIKVNSKDLELFSTLFKLADLNSRPEYILLTLLLILHKRAHQ